MIDIYIYVLCSLNDWPTDKKNCRKDAKRSGESSQKNRHLSWIAAEKICFYIFTVMSFVAWPSDQGTNF